MALVGVIGGSAAERLVQSALNANRSTRIGNMISSAGGPQYVSRAEVRAQDRMDEWLAWAAGQYAGNTPDAYQYMQE